MNSIDLLFRYLRAQRASWMQQLSNLGIPTAHPGPNFEGRTGIWVWARWCDDRVDFPGDPEQTGVGQLRLPNHGNRGFDKAGVWGNCIAQYSSGSVGWRTPEDVMWGSRHGAFIQRAPDDLLALVLRVALVSLEGPMHRDGLFRIPVVISAAGEHRMRLPHRVHSRWNLLQWPLQIMICNLHMAVAPTRYMQSVQEWIYERPDDSVWLAATIDEEEDEDGVVTGVPPSWPLWEFIVEECRPNADLTSGEACSRGSFRELPESRQWRCLAGHAAHNRASLGRTPRCLEHLTTPEAVERALRPDSNVGMGLVACVLARHHEKISDELKRRVREILSQDSTHLSPGTRLDLAEASLELGLPGAAQTCVELLEEPNPHNLRAALLFPFLPKEELVSLLRHSDSAVRCAAAMAMRHKAADDGVLAGLVDDPVPEVAEQARLSKSVLQSRAAGPGAWIEGEEVAVAKLMERASQFNWDGLDAALILASRMREEALVPLLAVLDRLNFERPMWSQEEHFEWPHEPYLRLKVKADGTVAGLPHRPPLQLVAAPERVPCKLHGILERERITTMARCVRAIAGLKGEQVWLELKRRFDGNGRLAASVNLAAALVDTGRIPGAVAGSVDHAFGRRYDHAPEGTLLLDDLLRQKAPARGERLENLLSGSRPSSFRTPVEMARYALEALRALARDGIQRGKATTPQVTSPGFGNQPCQVRGQHRSNSPLLPLVRHRKDSSGSFARLWEETRNFSEPDEHVRFLLAPVALAALKTFGDRVLVQATNHFTGFNAQTLFLGSVADGSSLYWVDSLVDAPASHWTHWLKESLAKAQTESSGILAAQRKVRLRNLKSAKNRLPKHHSEALRPLLTAVGWAIPRDWGHRHTDHVNLVLLLDEAWLQGPGEQQFQQDLIRFTAMRVHQAYRTPTNVHLLGVRGQMHWVLTTRIDEEGKETIVERGG